MAQRPEGTGGNDLLAKVRTWFAERLHGVLHGPEVGPERAQQGTSQAVEPEPSEAAREERGRRDAGVAEDAQELDERATALTGQPTIDTVESGTAVVTDTDTAQPGQSGQPSQPSQPSEPPEPSQPGDLSQSSPATAVEATDVSGDQHSLTTEPEDEAAALTDTTAGEEAGGANADVAAETTPRNQHDMQSFEPPLDMTRDEDVQTSSAGTAAAEAAASREGAAAWSTSDATAPQETSAATTGLPEDAEEFSASETATEDDVQADAESGSTWAPVHGDTSFDEMTREPVENVGGQTASVVPDVGGGAGTGGAAQP